MKKLSQKGFAVLEGLLILAIIGTIGGVGWFVYSSQKNTNKSLDNISELPAESSISSENARDIELASAQCGNSEQKVAKKAVLDFYNFWIGKNKPDQYLASSAFGQIRYSITPKAFEELWKVGGYDWFICAQEQPTKLEFENPIVRGLKATLEINSYYGDSNKPIHNIALDLIKLNRPTEGGEDNYIWHIDSVNCKFD